MSRKARIILLVVLLAVALLAAAALYGYNQLVAANNRYVALLWQRAHTLEYLEESRLTVEEGGEDAASLSLRQLGLYEAAAKELDDQLAAEGVTTMDAFNAMKPWEQLSWAKSAPAGLIPTELSLDGLDDGVVLDALGADQREQPQDASMRFSKGKYELIYETMGNALNTKEVSSRIWGALQGQKLPLSAPLLLKISLDEGCYLRPAVTVASAGFDVEKDFSDRVDMMFVRVQMPFDGEKKTLTSAQLRQLLSLSDDGQVQVDQDGLMALISEWNEGFAMTDTEFRFDSYVDGWVNIPFLKCSYSLDCEKLCQRMTDALLLLGDLNIQADFTCVNAAGEPLDLGDTYVEVDVSNQTMTFFKNGRLVVTTPVVTGRYYESPTPKGLYYANNKDTDCTLEGEDYIVFVKYWVSVTPDSMVGLHDASWRENFGKEFYVYGGSHGCINTPEAAMKVIHENIDDGTPILIYQTRPPVLR